MVDLASLSTYRNLVSCALKGNRSTNPGSVIRSPAVEFPLEEQQHDNGRTDCVLDGAGRTLGN